MVNLRIPHRGISPSVARFDVPDITLPVEAIDKKHNLCPAGYGTIDDALHAFGRATRIPYRDACIAQHVLRIPHPVSDT